MKLLRKFIVLLIVLAMVAAGMLFALQNREPVGLDLLFITFEPRSVALWILLAFALGGLLGVLASSAVILGQRAGRTALDRQLQKANAELDRLRTAGLTRSE